MPQFAAQQLLVFRPSATRRLARFSAGLMALVAAALSAPSFAQAPAEYEVQPGDVLGVSVWREVDLQLDVLVRPDGHFSMPLAGDVPATGKTVADLADEIASRLEQYIPDPEVSVAVREVRGSVYYVIGKVNRPGQYLLTGRTDVMQALSVAGGTTAFAKQNRIKVLRRNGEEQVAIPFSYGAVLNGDNLEQNINLQSGDTVVVP